ncbi:hypothetical protein BS47DRAFT_1388954 [Hydnum rufescens UP504]|uniref:Uncharacterized protein n=1 Tax=Hydnum rufescens UP504 TaxID=1448309 RepID=A0A9P6B6H6_9AGAM|nr:hypothetical protein BS47DRAFT_1388954 [Hydnum rufescens UP504]
MELKILILVLSSYALSVQGTAKARQSSFKDVLFVFRHFTPGSLPGMPYYPPVSLYPTPDQFDRQRVMPAIPVWEPPAPYVSPLIRSQRYPRASPEPVKIPSPVVLRPPQPQWQPVEVPTSSRPYEGFPIPPPIAQRRRKADRTRHRSSANRDSDRDVHASSRPHRPDRFVPRPASPPQQNPNSPRAARPPGQRAVDSDTDSYSAPPPHFQMEPPAEVAIPIMDFPQSFPSAPLASPLSSRKPTADEEPQLNVSTTLARPASSIRQNPNSQRAPPPPVQRAVDSDTDSYSAPSPQFPLIALADSIMGSSPSIGTTHHLPFGKIEIHRGHHQPPVQRPVDSDIDSFSLPPPHFLYPELADLTTDFSASSPSAPLASPRKRTADEEPQLNVSTTLARPPLPFGKSKFTAGTTATSTKASGFECRSLFSTIHTLAGDTISTACPEGDEEPQLDVSTTFARPTSSTLQNPNSPRAAPPVQKAVDSETLLIRHASQRVEDAGSRLTPPNYTLSIQGSGPSFRFPRERGRSPASRMPSSYSFVCCALTKDGTGQGYLPPPSYPLAIPYYPPDSFDPTPDQFRPRRVMPAIPRSYQRNPGDPAASSLPPKAYLPPVVQTPVVPHVPPPILSPEHSKSRPEPVTVPPRVILPPLQAQWQPVEIQTSSSPDEGSPIRPPIAQRRRKADQTRQWSSPNQDSDSDHSLFPRPPIQKAVDSDTDSYSAPSAHRMRRSGELASLDFLENIPSPLSSLSATEPTADKEPQLNVTTALTRPTFSTSQNPNSRRAVHKIVDSDADSYSAPSPHSVSRMRAAVDHSVSSGVALASEKAHD